MTKRWSMKELVGYTDIEFAIAILNERKKNLNPYSPLSLKIDNSIRTLKIMRNQ